MRELDPLVSASPVLQAGPAHIATLKTFDPPLRELEGRRFEGARRRGKWLLFPTADGALQLRIHLMSAGRIRHLAAGARRGRRRPRSGSASRTAASSCSPRRARRSARRLARVTGADRGGARAPRPGGARARRRGLRRSSPATTAGCTSLRDQRALAGIGRAHANEILHRARLSPFALSSKLGDEEIERLATARSTTCARARAAARREGRQGRLPRPPPARRAVPALRRPAAPGRLRGAHRLLLRALPDRRPDAEGPAPVAAAALALSTSGPPFVPVGDHDDQGGDCMAGQMVHLEIPAGDTATAREFWGGSSAGSSRPSRAARPSTT